VIETVYVAGPLTTGNLYLNTNRAVQLGQQLRLLGFLPFVPHAMSLGELICPVEYEDAMAIDFRWIQRLDCLLRCPEEWGPSKGADREVVYALSIGKPVFYSVEELIEARRMESCK
jgi:hypothetical protein